MANNTCAHDGSIVVGDREVDVVVLVVRLWIREVGVDYRKSLWPGENEEGQSRGWSLWEKIEQEIKRPNDSVKAGTELVQETVAGSSICSEVKAAP